MLNQDIDSRLRESNFRAVFRKVIPSKQGLASPESAKFVFLHLLLRQGELVLA